MSSWSNIVSDSNLKKPKKPVTKVQSLPTDRMHSPYQPSTGTGTGSWYANNTNVSNTGITTNKTNNTYKQSDGSFKDVASGPSGALDKYPAPYVPGISDNPAVMGTSAEVYRKHNSDGTPNRTFFPNAQGDGYYGHDSFNTTGGGSVGGGVPAPVSDEVKLTQQIQAGQGSAYDRLAEIMQGTDYMSYFDSNAPQKPGMIGAEDWAAKHGVMYDHDDRLNKYQDATRAQYANMDNEWARTQDSYYDMIAGNQDLMMGALRRGDREAAISGVTGGSRQAQELSAMLGLAQESSLGATELSQARGDLVSQREAAIAANISKALNDHNKLGLDMSGQAVTHHGNEMQGYVADQGYRGAVNSAAMASDASTRSAHANSFAGMYGADQNLAGNMYNADSNLAGTKYTADTNRATYGSSGGGGSWSPQQPSTGNPDTDQQIANLSMTLQQLDPTSPQAEAVRNMILELQNVKVPAPAKEDVEPKTKRDSQSSWWGKGDTR